MANNVTPLLTSILACLCTQLASDGHAVCECCVVVSDQLPPMRGCDCVCDEGQGVAWARFVGAEWQQTEVTKCPLGPWEVRLQIGVYRCLASEPTCETTTAEADMVAEDIASLQRAVLCCDALGGRRYTLGPVQVIGPAGGCVGSSLEIVLELATL